MKPSILPLHLCCVLLATLLLSACTPGLQQSKKRFFWPLPLQNVEPKIEYIDFLSTDKNLQLGAPAHWIERRILGEYPPMGLFKSPYWVASLERQNLVVTDTGLRQALILDLDKGEARPLMIRAGEPYLFMMPMGVAASADGEVFVVDALRAEVVRFGADEKMIEAFGGRSLLGHPVGIAINNRDRLIYVSDVREHNIAVFDLMGDLLYKIGERGREGGQFNFPTDIELDDEGNIYVLDSLNYRVQVLDSSGRFVREFGELGMELGSFRMPKGLAVGRHGQVYVTDIVAHKIVVFDYEGRYLMTLGDKSYALANREMSPGGFFAPRGIATDAAGRILVVDGLNKMIQRFQYLTEDYLKAHPIKKDEIYLPPEFRSLQ